MIISNDDDNEENVIEWFCGGSCDSIGSIVGCDNGSMWFGEDQSDSNLIFGCMDDECSSLGKTNDIVLSLFNDVLSLKTLWNFFGDSTISNSDNSIESNGRFWPTTGWKFLLSVIGDGFGVELIVWLTIADKESVKFKFKQNSLIIN